jgi:hypothetical protein
MVLVFSGHYTTMILFCDVQEAAGPAAVGMRAGKLMAHSVHCACFG